MFQLDILPQSKYNGFSFSLYIQVKGPTSEKMNENNKFMSS